MRTLLLVLLAFLSGFYLGVCTERKAVQVVVESPWPRPTPTPTTDELERLVARLQCDAEKAQAVFSERIRLTGKPNPPKE